MLVTPALRRSRQANHNFIGSGLLKIRPCLKKKEGGGREKNEREKKKTLK